MQLTPNTHAIYMQHACDLHATHMTQVLAYLLLNTERVVESWNARLYFYSSATLFKQVNPPLVEWILADKERRVECVTKLADDEPDSKMFRLLADAVFQFMKFKTQPFPSAMLSQEDFWDVKAWKRCWIFIFLYRISMNIHVSTKYHDWKEEDVVLTRTLFKRSVSLHATHMQLTCNSHVTHIQLACDSHATGG